MFDKILSHLPYNPSLVHQLAFYSRRMRQEAGLRRTGFIFIAMAFVIQFVAVVSPPQPTVASSPNDLVYGGFRTNAEAAGDCARNTPVSSGPGYGTILNYYGFTCAEVAAAPTVTINSYAFPNKSGVGQLWSMGRNDYPKPGETPVPIAGTNLYIRYLWGWGNVNYTALKVTRADGYVAYLLYDCGNLTTIGQPTPPPVPPKLNISKTFNSNLRNGSYVPPGALISYRLTWNNNGGAATNVTVRDTQPAYTTFYDQSHEGDGGYGFDKKTSTAYWTFKTMPAGAQKYYVDVRYKVNSDAPNGIQFCNVASVSSGQTSPVTSSPPLCLKVVVQTKPPASPPPSTPTAPCAAAVGSNKPYACVIPSKTATNITQNISDANGTTAKAGDVIVYTLTSKNTGTSGVSGYQFNEDMSDVLDYADITDLHGGTFDKASQSVTWPKQDIGAGATATHQITVKIKDPVPQTPPSSSDPEHFDLKMLNTWGNTVTINLPGTPVAVVETASTKLVNTGPGTSLFIGAAIVIIAGYFFARSRLLATEANLAVHNSTNGGI